MQGRGGQFHHPFSQNIIALLITAAESINYTSFFFSSRISFKIRSTKP